VSRAATSLSRGTRPGFGLFPNDLGQNVRVEQTLHFLRLPRGPGNPRGRCRMRAVTISSTADGKDHRRTASHVPPLDLARQVHRPEE